MTTIGIDFKKSIEIYEILQYYPILPKGLHWNMNENQEVVGIYFNKEDVVERYYFVRAKEGIIDFFRHEIKLEEDVEMLSLDIVDQTGAVITSIYNNNNDATNNNL
jgi:hypothetical protein